MKKITDTKIAEFIGVSPAMWSMFKSGDRDLSYKKAQELEVKIGLDSKFTMEEKRDWVVLAIKAFCYGRI
jgi:hypothetical protein